MKNKDETKFISDYLDEIKEKLQNYSEPGHELHEEIEMEIEKVKELMKTRIVCYLEWEFNDFDLPLVEKERLVEALGLEQFSFVDNT